MPINANYEYALAQEEYNKAQTTEERIKALQNMLSTAPTHKGAENLRDEIKRKLSRTKELLKKEKGKKGSGGIFSIKRIGEACVGLIGVTNSGKSYLLKSLTGAKVQISFHEYTTSKPEFGIMDYGGVKIQIIEIPAFMKNFNRTENGPTFLGIARMCDVLAFVVDMTKDVDFQVKLLKRELETNDVFKKTVILGVKGISGLDVEGSKNRIWKSLGLIRVYTRDRDRKKTGIPVALKKGSTIRDFANRIHKDFIKKFRYAKVWGDGAKFAGQQVGLEHVLKDLDTVELFEKKLG